jgi:AMP nucleosidase
MLPLSVPVVSNHTLNTLLLGELTARRLRSRMGIVYTTANRNWELHLALAEDHLRQSRALAVDRESATVAANGFRYRILTATLLAVSDKPPHAQPKLSADAQSFYAASRRQPPPARRHRHLRSRKGQAAVPRWPARSRPPLRRRATAGHGRS